jgi:hypothetical protein
MGRWWVILLLLLGVWQVVGSLIEKAGKKQQEQRIKDLAAQRGRQTGGQGPSQPAPMTPSRTAPRSATDRAEALAARRREQLEQLRMRRAGQKQGTQQPTTPTPTARTAATPPPKGQRQISQLQPGRVQTTQKPATVIRRAASHPRTQPPTTRPARPTPQRVVTPPPAPAQPQEPAPIEGESSTRRVVKDVEVAPKAPKTRHLPLPFVPGEPLGPHVLRQMVLFREILEPPVSLRDRQVWERY